MGALIATTQYPTVIFKKEIKPTEKDDKQAK